MSMYEDTIVQQKITASDSYQRRFFIGDSDYSDYVSKWPKFKTSWNGVRANNITINLSNEDQLFNFFHEDKTKIKSPAAIMYGAAYSTDQLITEHNTLAYSPFWNNYNVTWADSFTAADASPTVYGYLLMQSSCHMHDSGVTESVFEILIKQNSANLGNFGRLSYSRFTENGSIHASSIYFLSSCGSYRLEGHDLDVPINKYRSGIFETTSDGQKWFTIRLHSQYVVDSNNAFVNSGQLSFFPSIGYMDGDTWLDSASGMAEVYLESIDMYGAELDDIYQGTVDKVAYNDTQCGVTIADKFKQLSERVVGTSKVPVNYTGSDYLPSDLAWWLITSYGGYDITEDTTNIDIDYDSFATWAAIFSGSGIYMEAYFDGQKVTEGLRKLSRMTQSAIFIKNNKFMFHRFSIVDSNSCELDAECIKDFALDIDDANMINRQYVFADYDQSSDMFDIAVVDASTSSVNSFGPVEDVEQDKNIWYVNSVGANDLASRILFVKGVPYDQITITTGAQGFLRNVGETVSVTWPHLNIASSYRIMERSIDIDKLTTMITADRSQMLEGFILDTSSLNGSDLLS